jgi:hypothetical protein
MGTPGFDVEKIERPRKIIFAAAVGYTRLVVSTITWTGGVLVLVVPFLHWGNQTKISVRETLAVRPGIANSLQLRHFRSAIGKLAVVP